MNLKNKKILLIGGSGFIGQFLYDFLTKKKAKVFVFSRKKPSFTKNFIKGDVTNYNSVLKATKGFDAVVHLAGNSLARGKTSISQDFKINSLGTFYVLQACYETKVQKVVYLSTCKIYGSRYLKAVKESFASNPETSYAMSKFLGELYANFFNRVLGLNVVILRLFNVYGSTNAKNKAGIVTNAFTKAVLQGKPLEMHGNKNNANDFVHVSDVCNAVYLALKKEKISGEVFNIASGKPITFIELAKAISKLTGKKFSYKVTGKTKKQVLYANVSKAKKMLGFKSKEKLETGLKELIHFFNS